METNLGKCLVSYTNKSENYDPELDKILREIRPDWFLKSSEINKNIFLNIAQRGSPKPKGKDRNLLKSYTYIKSQTYDTVFDKKIRELRPDWFIKTPQLNKNKLLASASDGDPKPKSGSKLLSILNTYTRLKSKCYDKRFHDELKSIRPDWFEKKEKIKVSKKKDRIKLVQKTIKKDKSKILSSPDVNKMKLIDMALKGDPKPVCTKGHPMRKTGKLLDSYTKKGSSYDPEFDKKIRELRPDWFQDRCALNKDRLIQIALSGGERPHYKEKIRACLNAYLSKNNDAYDKEFSKKIRELRPDWFK